jgi:pimeloyl-ACP methyl ester carboxylesterase
MFDRIRHFPANLIVPLGGVLAASVLFGDSSGRADEARQTHRAASIPIREGQVKANGITIAYRSFGREERPAVLLIMGYANQLTQWPVELCEELVRRGYRVIAFDNRDVGLSTKFDAAGPPDWKAITEAMAAGRPAPLSYTIHDMAKDAVGLLDALGVKKAHLVGASMGGIIAQIVATDYLEHALSLTSLAAPSGRPGLPIIARPDVAARIPPPAPVGYRKAYIEVRVKGSQFLGSPSYPTDEKRLRERFTADVERSYAPAGEARQAAVALVATVEDRRERLKTVRVPTVVVHGTEDPLVPVDAGRDVAANIPGAELRLIPGMGHDLPIQLASTIADAITAAARRSIGNGAASVRVEEAKVQANGVTLAYRSVGPPDHEAVLMIMGNGAQLTAWPIELVEELVWRGYRVIIYDNRDVGVSTRFDGAGIPDAGAVVEARIAGRPSLLPYSLADMAKDAVGLLDALHIKKAHIVGVSMGGMIAQLVAAEHPEHTLSLTSIMSTSGKPGLPFPADPGAVAKMPPPAPEGDPEASIANAVKVIRILAGPDYPPDEKRIREMVVRSMKRSADRAGMARHNALSALGLFEDRRAKLQAIRVPTVVVHGDKDPIMSIEGGKDTAENIPGAELRIIPGMRHDLPIPLINRIADAITAAASRAAESAASAS